MHHNHFHIDIGRPDIVSLDNLLAQGANTDQAVAYADGQLLEAAQTLAAAITPPLHR